MKIQLDMWTIIIVGKWNSKIFTPSWVKDNLSFDDNVALEVNLTNFNIRLFDDNLSLMATKNNLTLSMQTLNTENIQKIQTVAQAIVQKLPHTPMDAFGINFGFIIENEPPENLLRVFEMSDLSKIAEFNASVEISKKVISKTLKFDAYELNYHLIEDNGKFIINLNYHHPIKNVSEAEAMFAANKLEEYRDYSLEFLKSVYGVNLEDDEHDI